MAPCFAAMMMPKFPPETTFFHRQADSHYASNLNHKLSSVMRIEDKEKPAYLLGYAYGLMVSVHERRPDRSLKKTIDPSTVRLYKN
jgi:hypothetical protein